MPRTLFLSAGVLLWGSLTGEVRAQERDSLSLISTRLASIAAVTGYEQAMVDTLLRLLPGAVRDRAGNARLTLGGGRARRLVVCPVDEPGYVVGRVREDGYLTLRRVPGRVSPLYDQQLEGHRVTVYGRRGPIPGVVAVRSIHLTRGREPPNEAPFSVDDALVDVGATSPAEVTAGGVRVLAPVTLAKRPHSYGDRLLAAPVAGQRAACAALVLAARESRVRAKLIPPVTLAFVVEHELSERGLGTLANELGPFDQTLIVDGRAGTRGSLQQVTDSTAPARWPNLGTVARWSLPLSYADTAVETVWLGDAEALQQAIFKWIGADP